MHVVVISSAVEALFFKLMLHQCFNRAFMHTH